MKTVFDDTPDSTYTLNRRITADQLYTQLADKLYASQENHKKNVREAINQFRINIAMCSKMDDAFGSNYEDCGEKAVQLVKSKDGSHLVRCPLSKCSSTTYKLRRHLRDIHPTLPDVAHEFAVEISKKIERNKGENIVSTIFLYLHVI